MCGRFTLRTPTAILVEQFQLGGAPQLTPRFNIAPTQPIALVRLSPGDDTRRLTLARWGLVPPWAKDPSMGARMINARGETVASKPAFRAAFRRRRCLVPADGYYEWQKLGNRKQPFHLRMQDNRPFALAGLWEQWRGDRDDDAEPLQTCTIITTQANELGRPIHDRMPVILDAADYELWLDPQMQDSGRIEPLLRPYDSAAMVAEPVSTYVNNVRHDGPKCLELQRGLF
jgi:putative SOS response-associated peptidase YedK